MAINNVVRPPTMKNGNPLSAFGVNQLIEATNFYGEQVFGNNTGWQKFIAYGQLLNNENKFVLVHKYDTLYIKIYHDETLVPFKVYAKKAGTSQLITILDSSLIPSGNSSTVLINLQNSINGFSVNNGDIYFIQFEWNRNNASGMTMVEYVHELQTSYWTVPTIPTLSAGTVIDDNYLNILVNAVRNLSTLNSSTNHGFSGPRTNKLQSQSNTYLRWRLKRKNRYLHIGVQVTNPVIIRIYLDDNLIREIQKTGNTIENFTDIFDLNTISGFVVPSLGTDYEVKIRSSDGVQNNHFVRANYVWELPTP